MVTVSGDFELTMDELRVVARFVLESAEQVLPVFEDANPADSRPRAAIDAAREFADGAKRTARQRVTSLDAHRAAREATTEVARLAARSAGDAASAAYLHPLARAHQVGHILRAAASAAGIAELQAGDDADIAAALEQPALLQLYLEYDQVHDLDPTDPRVDDLADRIVSATLARYGDAAPQGPPASDISDLMQAAVNSSSLAWRRLDRLIRSRLTRPS